ncbi:MAG TPA: MoaD/ThiS family protein [Bdellovibrionota bacterium]|nr:MoaD/ThiS family protein [Bdellovibrionota bacterium]
MKVKLKYFAVYQDILGCASQTVDAEGKITVRKIFDQVMKDVKLKEQYFKSTLFAVNLNFVSPESIIKEGDEVAFIPPVAGG